MATSDHASPNFSNLEKALKLDSAYGPIDGEINYAALYELCIYECWKPYERLLKKHFNEEKRVTTDEFLFHCEILEEISQWDLLAEISACWFLQCNSGYSTLKLTVLARLDLDDNAWALGMIYGSLFSSLVENSDKIACLEDLCDIYENADLDDDFFRCLEKLLCLDPQNQKALKFMKSQHWNTQDFEKLTQVLESLLESSEHPSDRFRLGLEIASVYFYQLSDPVRCLDILARYCREGHLDISPLKFEALVEAKRFDDARMVLLDSFHSLDDDKNRSLLFYKLSQLSENINLQTSMDELFQCIRLNPRFFEAHEKLISLLVERKDWARTIEHLSSLSNVVSDSEKKAKLLSLVKQIELGLQNAD